MSNRSATDTIKGYFYQFDYSILQLLSLSNDTDEIVVEGVEDIDIATSLETIAIQCKYYSKTEYNHSVISKPIRFMLSHFGKAKSEHKPQIKYHLYGHYKSGHNKLTLPIDVNFLKDKFLSYKVDGTQKKHHEDLGLNDRELQNFLDTLSIDINAKEYLEQFDDIISLLKGTFSCDLFDAEYYFYNNALNEIRKIAIENNINDRKISKQDFLKRINRKTVLFNKWFFELKGKAKYHKELKDRYFRRLNKRPFERFFLIDLPANYAIGELKDLVFIISKRYSNLKKREPQTYCPYIHFNNISDGRLLELKKQLYDEGFEFRDGFPFSGADFSAKSIATKADSSNNIKAKILTKETHITDTLTHVTKTKEVYQFYFDKPYLSIPNVDVKSVVIQINDLGNIKEII
ncbi:MAG: DUF4297 family anti-phage-associated protein [Thermodesulfobacteriota bacterium]